MKKIIASILTGVLCFCITGCSSVYYYFNDAVSFRLENESTKKIYGAAVSFGTNDTVFGTMSGENADGSPFADKGKDCVVFQIEKGDMNDTKIEDMVFEFFVCTEKDNDFTYIGTVNITSSKLHQTYTLTITESNEKLALTCLDTNIVITMN